VLTSRALRRGGIAFTGRPAQVTALRLARTRVAFLGFAAYRWASALGDPGAVPRLVRGAAADANVVVVFMHAGPRAPTRSTRQIATSRRSASTAGTCVRSRTRPCGPAPTSCWAQGRTCCAASSCTAGG
jgi:hypothetical protein